MARDRNECGVIGFSFDSPWPEDLYRSACKRFRHLDLFVKAPQSDCNCANGHVSGRHSISKILIQSSFCFLPMGILNDPGRIESRTIDDATNPSMRFSCHFLEANQFGARSTNSIMCGILDGQQNVGLSEKMCQAGQMFMSHRTSERSRRRESADP
jgi:hypothetical protein